MFKLKLNKRIVALALSVVVIAPLGLSAIPVSAEPTQSNTTTGGNSNDRVKQFIEFSKDKGIADVGDVSQISYSDLRAIGIFISNFYQSWETELDFKNGDDDTKDKIVSFLSDSCNFDDSVAKQIVDACWQISKSSAKELHLGYTTDGQTANVADVNKNKVATYADFMRYMHDDSADVTHCLAWKDDVGVFHTALTGYSSQKGFSAGASAYGMYTGLTSDGKVYGTSVTLAEDRDSAIDLVTNATDESIDSSSTGAIAGSFPYNWYLYEDAFGNILMDTKDKQLVLLPACQNPYTWTDNDRKAGQRVPLNNIKAMSNANATNASDSSLNIHKNDNNYEFNMTSKGVLTEKYWSWCPFDKDDIGLDGDYPKNDGRYDFMDGKAHWNSVIMSWFTSKDDLKNYGGIFATTSSGETWSGGSWVRDSDVLALDISAWSNWGDCNAGSCGKNRAFEDMIIIDDIQSFNSSTTTSFNMSPNGIFSKDKNENGNYMGLLKTGGFGFQPKISNGVYDFSDSSEGKRYMVSMFITYLFAEYGTGNVALTNGTMTSHTNIDGLPPIKLDGCPFDTSDAQKALDEANKDKQTDEIRTMVYYMLNPAKGTRYFKQWFKTKASAMLVGIHESIVGKGSDANLGVTKYTGFEGYTVTPELSDVSWTNILLEKYQSIFVVVVVVIGLILIGYVLVGSLTPQKAIIGLVLFSFSAYIVPSLIDFTINTSNKVSTSIYGEKFTYWALVQHQSYSKDIDTSAEGASYEDYLETQMMQKANISKSTAITLKWQCPKKNNYMYSANKDLGNSRVTNSGVLKYLVNADIGSQTFLDKPNAEYLYRSYTDISNNSRYLYRNLKTLGGRVESSELANTVEFNSTKYKSQLDSSKDLGFEAFSTKDIKQYRWNSLYTSKVLRDAITQDYSKLTQDDSVGINPKGEESLDYDIASINNNTKSGKQTNEARMSALAPFALYTESPFYYFSWNFYDQGMSCDNDATNGFKNLVLGSKTGGEGTYFYNTNTKADTGYGDVRDYLDMRSLFTAVIPVLKESNNKVLEWDNLYGLDLYDGIPCDEGVSTEGFNSEQLQQYWHNKCVAKIWNMYTPWLDVMYDCSYAKPQNIVVNGEKYLVKDPLDYRTYWVDKNNDGEWNSDDEGRPMIFSRSEMKYYGLSESDLTAVEQKVLNVQDSVMDDLYKLNNYVTFNDEVLNTASAMIVTFDFNKEFSQSGLLTEGHQLYPQAFELKNFSYDAYLRLILASASGESLLTSDNKTSLYQTILENTGVVTGILLVINDVIAVHCISCVKLFFLVGIFLLSILMLICSALKLDLKITTVVWKILITPLIKFLCINIGHALIVSLFMSDGATGVTGTSATTISTGEPTTAIILMLILNITVFYLYFRVTRDIVKDVIKYTKAVSTSVQGVAGQLYTGITGVAVGSAFSGAIGTTGSALKTGAGLSGATVGGTAKISGNVAESAGKHAKAGAKTVNSVRDVARYGKVVSTDKKKSRDSSNKFDELCKKGRKKLNTQSSKSTNSSTNKSTNKKRQLKKSSGNMPFKGKKLFRVTKK